MHRFSFEVTGGLIGRFLKLSSSLDSDGQVCDCLLIDGNGWP